MKEPAAWQHRKRCARVLGVEPGQAAAILFLVAWRLEKKAGSAAPPPGAG